MSIKTIIEPLIPKWVLGLRKEDVSRFAFDHKLDVRSDIQDKYHYFGDLLELFAANEGPVVHKWHHYIPLYERYFSRFRGHPFRFLEIGVSQGGSLQMWRKYFGEHAKIFGIDIDPKCKRFDGQFGEVRIGSQVDKSFLDAVIKEMGGVDAILDDGSHQMDHVHETLKLLFPLLSDGGIYMIEDLHTAYWSKWGGGYRSNQNFFGRIMDLVDDMHRWYHGKGLNFPGISESCSGIHIHDSIVVLEKGPVFPPVHSRNR